MNENFTINSERVRKTSRESSRDRPREDKKKKNKLVFKNNIMNKVDSTLPTGSNSMRNLNNNNLNLGNDVKINEISDTSKNYKNDLDANTEILNE